MVSAATVLALAMPIAPTGQTVDLAGNLAVSVPLHDGLSYTAGVSGRLQPLVSFHGDLTLGAVTLFAGGLTVHTTFGPSSAQQVLGLQGALIPILEIYDLPPLGHVSIRIVFGAATLTSGPLWNADVGPPDPWQPADLCNG